MKNRPTNHQRSMSLSTIVFHYSKSSLFRQHPPLLSEENSPQRRALSYEQLFSSDKFNPRPDPSILASGCSLAMNFSNRENPSVSSVSSSSSTIHTDDESPEKKPKPFKWKLRINK